jgi:predicted acylesterase/phospholipase RssA
MEGGIASGVAYPSAILELYRRYRFRSIGGASAGAIAAAVTAAAERNREGGGFERFRGVKAQLAQPGFLQSLFQPSDDTRPLLAVALDLSAALEGGATVSKPGGFRLLSAFDDTLWSHLQLACLKGIAWGGVLCLLFLWPPAVACLLFAFTADSPAQRIFCGYAAFSLFLIGLLILFLGRVLGGSAALVQTALQKLQRPENGFGVCPGHRPEVHPGASPVLTPEQLGDSPSLTDWLTATLDHVAGKTDGPLTFGDLKRKQIRVARRNAQTGAREETEQDVGIELKMVTSNLSQEQTYILPFQDNRFLFSEADMRRLFPENIVRHLIRQSHQSRSVKPPDGYHFLPEPDELPVVLATRMSLSLPVLLSAVPLYTIRVTAFTRRATGELLALKPEDLQRNWFADGGISSNFPIHFFDAWLPTRPTFGINFVYLDREEFVDTASPAPSHLKPERVAAFSDNVAELEPVVKAVSALAAPGTSPTEAVWINPANRPPTPEWTDVRDLFGFGSAIFSTAMNSRDTMQSQLPSYRERIAQIRLAKDEGGVNLNMPPATLKAVLQKGATAGRLLSHFQLEPHQWVRFQVLMAQLEKQLHSLYEAFESGMVDFDALVAEQSHFPYHKGAPWCRDAMAVVAELQRLLNWWDTRTPSQTTDSWQLFAKGPKPEPTLRVTPNV